MSKRRFGFDLLSLSMHEWRRPEVSASIKSLAAALMQADPAAEIVLVAPKFMAPEWEGQASPRLTTYFLPIPALLPPRIYAQQTLLPVLFRLKNVNQVISFGQGVPVLYPAPKLLSLLPGQIRDWWKLVPALMTADAVTVDSVAQKMSLETRIPRIKAKIEALPLAVGEEYHPYPKDAGREVLERAGIKGRYFLFFGSTEASSPCMVALEAFAKIAHRPRLKSVTCVLAGARGLTIGMLRKRIDELGLTHRVIITGTLPESDTPLWLSNALFSIFPDVGEDSPLTFLRALSSGCPVIVPAFRLFDAKFKPAVLQCHDSDPKSLAEAMTKIIADPQVRDDLVKESLELMSGQTWDKRADALIKYLDEAQHQRTLSGNSPDNTQNLMAG